VPSSFRNEVGDVSSKSRIVTLRVSREAFLQLKLCGSTFHETGLPEAARPSATSQPWIVPPSRVLPSAAWAVGARTAMASRTMMRALIGMAPRYARAGRRRIPRKSDEGRPRDRFLTLLGHHVFLS
jgi:hypothetical protein